MQEIAAKAGLSTGAIYLYYENKEALLVAINRRSMEMGRKVIQEARERSVGPLGAMRSIGAAMVSVFSDPGFETATKLNIEMWPEVIRSPELAEGYRREVGFWREEVGRLLREAQEAGEIRRDADPDTIAVLSICAWEGLRHYKLIDPTISEEILVAIVQPYLSADQEASALDIKSPPRMKGMPWILPKDAQTATEGDETGGTDGDH
jgi:TetR/AcrR family fatty acid metabolism transcriptional regulator